MAGEVEVTAVSRSELEVKEFITLVAGQSSFKINLPEAIPEGKVGRARIDILIVVEDVAGE